MAKKRKAKAKNVSPAEAKLPEGFTALSVGGGFGAWWDFEKQKTLLGKVSGFDSYMAEDDKGKKKKRGIMRVEQKNGVTLSVGESFSLKELFTSQGQKQIRGKTIFLQFQGQKKFKDKKGKPRKVNQFAAAVSK